MTGDDIHITRKVQQLGSSTLAVTLPAEWAREYDVEKGDSVAVQCDESSGSLLVVPDRALVDDGETTVRTDGFDADAVRRASRSATAVGGPSSDGPVDASVRPSRPIAAPTSPPDRGFAPVESRHPEEIRARHAGTEKSRVAAS